ncbi:MAG: hypothetical protein K2X87_08905 [Gemmataceae bacterium]|nr:hypothetical protein [Gemmataceae bacterium]
MTPCDLILAAALITAPPGCPEPTPAADRWPAVRAALVKTALDWELLDERETRYVLARAEDFDGDLNLLRRRHADLADAPRLADAGRFPGAETVNEAIRFNRAYRKNLEVRQLWEADRSDAIRVVVAETDRLYKAWDAVRDARCEFYYATVRRAALKRLKEMVGEDAFAAGELPPYVPEWRFQPAR